MSKISPFVMGSGNSDRSWLWAGCHKTRVPQLMEQSLELEAQLEAQLVADIDASIAIQEQSTMGNYLTSTTHEFTDAEVAQHRSLVPLSFDEAMVQAGEGLNKACLADTINLAPALLDSSNPDALIKSLAANGFSEKEVRKQVALEKHVRKSENIGVVDGSNDGAIPADGAVFLNVNGGKFVCRPTQDPAWVGSENTLGSCCKLAEKNGEIVVHPFGSWQEGKATGSMTLQWFRQMIGPGYANNVQGCIQEHNSWVDSLPASELTAHLGRMSPKKRKHGGRPPRVSDWVVLRRIASRPALRGDKLRQVGGHMAAFQRIHPERSPSDAVAFVVASGGRTRGVDIWREFMYQVQETAGAALTEDECNTLRDHFNGHTGEAMPTAFTTAHWWLGR